MISIFIQPPTSQPDLKDLSSKFLRPRRSKKPSVKLLFSTALLSLCGFAAAAPLTPSALKTGVRPDGYTYIVASNPTFRTL